MVPHRGSKSPQYEILETKAKSKKLSKTDILLIQQLRVLVASSRQTQLLHVLVSRISDW
jgi:hypothetical protein